MRRRMTAFVLAAVTAALLPGPARAATVNISIVGIIAGFSPTTTTRAFGTTFTWKNNDSIGHTTTQNAPLSLWNSGTLSPNTTFSKTIRFAGTYAYHCAIHPTTMKGTIKVPIKVSPASGSTSTAFTISVAAVPAPIGFVYDVQMKQGHGAWTKFKLGLTKKSVKFDPMTKGIFSFRSRLRKKANRATSGWSPAKSISVS